MEKLRKVKNNLSFAFKSQNSFQLSFKPQKTKFWCIISTLFGSLRLIGFQPDRKNVRTIFYSMINSTAWKTCWQLLFESSHARFFSQKYYVLTIHVLHHNKQYRIKELVSSFYLHRQLRDLFTGTVYATEPPCTMHVKLLPVSYTVFFGCILLCRKFR